MEKLGAGEYMMNMNNKKHKFCRQKKKRVVVEPFKSSNGLVEIAVVEVWRLA